MHDSAPVNLPRRKALRLPNFDYQSSGAYFVTVCTQGMKRLLWHKEKTQKLMSADFLLTESDAFIPPLSGTGQAVCTAIAEIPQIYQTVTVDAFSVMPDHFHMILGFPPDAQGMPLSHPSLSRVIQQLKRAISLEAGKRGIWQKSFHDRIIRNGDEYQKIKKYIADNPIRWVLKQK